MKIAFPTESDNGLESTVYNHFGSANFFVIVDTTTEETSIVSNRDLDHQHGKCQPLKALGGKNVDAVVTGGIGGPAMKKLKQGGAKIFKAIDGTVKDNVDLLLSGKLVEFMPFNVCGGHTGNCAH